MQFNILAVDSRQQVVALNLEAASEALAADQARSKGLTVISVSSPGLRLALPKCRTRFPATLFSMELLSLLTGFKGRKAIRELLVLNGELRELIAARAAGTVPLRNAAMALVQAGETTLEEINRVTFVA